MMKPRTKKRASSRAHTVCLHCGKKLHGEKGLAVHLKQVHNV
jgi:hypothetical protein